MNPRGPVVAEDLWVSSHGFFRVWVVHLGRRAGLVQVLDASPQPLSPARLANRTGADPSAVATWCEAAHALGLLERARGAYRIPAALRPILADEKDPRYLAGQFSYLALRSLDYGGFDDLFRGRARTRPSAHLVEATREATTWDHTAFLEIALREWPGIRASLRAGARVLDVGSGSGEWILRLARQFPRASFVGVEPDLRALRAARRRASGARLAGRVRFERGTVEGMAFREEFDLVHLGEVLSALPAKVRALRACRRALRRGGSVVLSEGLLDARANPRTPPNPLLLAIQLDFALLGTRLLTRPEVFALLREAGFRRSSFLHAGGGLWFVRSWK